MSQAEMIADNSDELLYSKTLHFSNDLLLVVFVSVFVGVFVGLGTLLKCFHQSILLRSKQGCL
jgi:hypothetical protein